MTEIIAIMQKNTIFGPDLFLIKYNINSMKKYLLILTVSCAFIKAQGQTNVSGGIFFNTTWTQANSPYIITDTVVVFPNVTLTIQPGVIVEFADNKRLEIRQGNLIAHGTVTDSITFTSNSPSPTPGIYDGIYLNGGNLLSSFMFCNFSYANNVISTGGNITTSYHLYVKNSSIISNINAFNCNVHLYIDSCIFRNNNVCVFTVCTANHCIVSNNNIGISALNDANGNSFVQNCVIDSNQQGILSGQIVSNCTIQYNQVGVDFAGIVDNCVIKFNQVGGYMNGGPGEIKNSIIDSNVVGIRSYGSGNRANNIKNCNIRYNGIGIIDSSCVGSIITKNYIENNNIGIKLHTYQDSIYCNRICNNSTFNLQYLENINTNCVRNNFWCTQDSAFIQASIYDGFDNVNYGLVFFMPIDSLCSMTTAIIGIVNNTFMMHPNPFSNSTTLWTDNAMDNAALIVINSYGQTVRQKNNISGHNVILQRANLPTGLYLIRLVQDRKAIATKKLIITD